jgi:hypothetical protein
MNARRAMIISSAALVALSLCSCACTPDLRISGTVVDASTGLPIAGARVSEGSYATELSALRALCAALGR